MSMIHRLLHYFTGCWHGYRTTDKVEGHGVVADRAYNTTHFQCCLCGYVSEGPPFYYLMGPVRIKDAPRGL